MSTDHETPSRKDIDGISEKHGQRPPVYFMVLFLGLIVWGVIFSAYYLLSGWSSQEEFKEKMTVHQQQMESTAQSAAAAPAQAAAPGPDGAALFASNCAVCHGQEGKGGIGPDLTRSSFKFGRSADEIATSIAGGRPGGMPAFANQLSQAQIAALAAHILSLK